MPIGMLAAGLLLLFIRSLVGVPVLRAVLLPLSYALFTLALFDGVGTVRSLLGGHRRRG